MRQITFLLLAGLTVFDLNVAVLYRSVSCADNAGRQLDATQLDATQEHGKHRNTGVTVAPTFTAGGTTAGLCRAYLNKFEGALS